MSTNLYLKLPHRILHTPTWIRLSNSMKALAIQIALVAGDTDAEADGGLLPALDDLAVLLRVDAEELETDMVALEDVGYVKRDEGRWYAAEFMRWQEVETPQAKRMRKLRARQRAKRASEESVTVTSPERHYVTHTEPEQRQNRTEPEAEPTTTEALARESRVVVGPPSSTDDPMSALLQEQGVTEQTARRLSQEHKAPEIHAGIAVAREYASTHGCSNFPGFVVKAIQQGWQPADVPGDYADWDTSDVEAEV